jgi:hypothetical protein
MNELSCVSGCVMCVGLAGFCVFANCDGACCLFLSIFDGCAEASNFSFVQNQSAKANPYANDKFQAEKVQRPLNHQRRRGLPVREREHQRHVSEPVFKS